MPWSAAPWPRDVSSPPLPPAVLSSDAPKGAWNVERYPVTAFILPVNIKSPMTNIRTPPTLTVYFTTLTCVLKNSRSEVVNSPTARNGRTKPMVYTPISPKAIALVLAEAAISSTLARAGPTHGVHAKLKVNPMSSAVNGDMARASSLNGSLRSLPSTWDVPKKPSWYSPKSTTRMPPTLANISWLLLKKFPMAEKPNPSRKNAKLTPMTKQRVWIMTFFRS